MINIKIDEHILKRHRTFLMESALLQDIQNLRKEDLLNDLHEKFGDLFVTEHCTFCHCLCNEYRNMTNGISENIFLGTPTYLHKFIQHVQQTYTMVHEKIQTDPEYANCIYQAFGYDRFVNSHGFIKASTKNRTEEGNPHQIKEYTLENFDDSEEDFKWGAYAYALSLKTKVCPYCNRNYITPLYSENGKMRADLDHFFAKSVYPYLSISIFNLVPSCKFCNSSLKGKNEFTYEGNFHPLDEIEADSLYRITYAPKSAVCFFGKEDFDIELEYNQAEINWQKMKGNSDALKIREIYQYHKDIVTNFIKKRYIYDDGYIEYLWKSYPNLFSSREEVIIFLLTPYDISQSKDVPLGKLMKDLIEELDF